jgi:hypothetical protein
MTIKNYSEEEREERIQKAIAKHGSWHLNVKDRFKSLSSIQLFISFSIIL